MSEIVDRVAQAIHERFVLQQDNPGVCPSWADLLADTPMGHEIAEENRDLARIAIAAMREPTDAMVEACDGMIEDAASPYDTWRRMIDEALK